MKKSIFTVLVSVLFSTFVLAQFSMDSDGKTLRNSSNSSCGRIDSDGRTIRNGSNSSVGSVDSDGKTIRNGSNSSVLRVDGNDIRNSSNSVIAKMSDVTNAIKGAQPTAAYVALWWFIVKGNR